MATYSDVINGLRILSNYEVRSPLCAVAAEHDVIYAGHGVTPERIHEAHRAELYVFGWVFDDEVGAWRKDV